MNGPGPASLTVGVALPVPDPWGSHLQRARVDLGEVRANRIPTHITLLPPTDVPSELLPELQAHLRSTAAAQDPFSVVLRGTGTFRPVSDVVFVQVAQGVACCEMLHRAVGSGPVSPQTQFPYHPHVTVAHDVDGGALDRAFAELADFTCAFEATLVRLYAHNGDHSWRREADYPLAGLTSTG